MKVTNYFYEIKQFKDSNMNEELERRNKIKTVELMKRFDIMLARVIKIGLYPEEEEALMLECLSEYLEEAMGAGMTMADLQDRANQLASYALKQGYSHEEVTQLLTMRPNQGGGLSF